jgi:3-carboxy-cis,cis-muconate cycloisomerase
MKPSSSMSSEWEAIFNERTRLQRMLDFEAALARAEAACGVIPKTAPPAITRCAKAELYDPQKIADAAVNAGNPAIPLVKLLTAEVTAIDTDAARYVHWGATSQDVMDTGLMLQLRDAFQLVDEELQALCAILARLADAHRMTPVAARTWMQQAIPTTLGLKFAGWLDALHRQRVRMKEARQRILVLQFGGAAGSLAALGAKGLEVSEALASDLMLTLPALPWHTERDRVAEAATLFGLLAGTLGKMARDISLMVQSEVAELAEPAERGHGGSSTMPHKRNPVACASILATSLRLPGLISTMLAAMVQEHERALGGWQAEWETLPQIISLCGDALQRMTGLLSGLEINIGQMLTNLEVTHGLIYAESASMLLATRMGKAAAHELLEKVSRLAVSENKHLREVLMDDAQVRTHFANADITKLFEPLAYMGMANDFITRTIKTLEE